MIKKAIMSLFVFIMLSMAVSAAGDSSISNAPTDVTSTDGTYNGTFTLTNTGAGVINTITFTASDLVVGDHTIAGANIAFTPANLASQAAAQADDINFSLDLTTVNQYAGTYVGTITAKDATEAHSDQFTYNLVVAANDNTSVADSTVTVGKGGARKATFKVTNTGNTDLAAVALSATALSDGSNTIPNTAIAFSESSFALNYNAEKDVNVTVTIPADATNGVYESTITATYGGKTSTGKLTVTVQDASHTIAVSTIRFEDAKINTTQNLSFTITNNGNTDLTNVQLVNVDIAEVYSPQFDNTAVGTIEAGASATRQLTISIPDNQDSGLLSLGSIRIEADQTNHTVAASADVIGFLVIEEIDVYVDGDSDKDLTDGDTIGEKAKPESSVKFKVKVRNEFTNADDIKIDDIEVEVKLKDIDDGDDLDETKDVNKLDPGDSDTVSIEFDIPLMIDEGKYDVQIEAVGEDDNGIDHKATAELELTVSKDNHDIRIVSATLDRNTASQCTPSFNLRTKILNVGEDEEDEVAINVFNSQLGILENYVHDEDLEAGDDDDSELRKNFAFTLKKGIATGTYPIEVRAFYDGDKGDARESVDLIVESCKEEEPEEKPEEDEIVVVTTPEQGNTGGSTSSGTTEAVPVTVKPKESQSFTEGTSFTVLLVLANIAVVLIILWMLGKLLL